MSGMNEHENGRKPESEILYLFGEINDGLAARVCEQIIGMNMRGEAPYIQMLINSAGGSVSAGFAIIDMMEWSQLPVYTTGIGRIASTGLLIFMAGAHGHRVVTPRTSILSHRFAGGAVGNHSELVATRKEQDLVHCRIVNHYLQHTAIAGEEELSRTLLRDVDTWLTTEEAVRLGIADVVQSDRKRPWPAVLTRDLARTLEQEREVRA